MNLKIEKSQGFTSGRHLPHCFQQLGKTNQGPIGYQFSSHQKLPCLQLHWKSALMKSYYPRISSGQKANLDS